MDGTRYRLLQSLDQSRFRTGTEIGAALGLSRAAIHKHVQALVKQGVPIHRVPGRGYRLADGVSLLSEEVIKSAMSEQARVLLDTIDVLDEIDSTNAYLIRNMGSGPVDGRVCVAERQSAGRGRRGRSWVASPYRDLMMSIGIEYPQWPLELPTLGLVTALMLVEALGNQGVGNLQVKWPNDVVHEGRKLCGVLLDVTGEGHGICRVVAGIGINVSMEDDLGRSIDQRWVDLETLTGSVPDRNVLTAQCLNALLPMFRSFPSQGFVPYQSSWRHLDALHGRLISIHGADGSTQEGKAAGVDALGQLQVIGADGELRLFTQGDVKVRVR